MHALEATIKITPTVVLTNALPYYMEGMLLSTSNRSARAKRASKTSGGLQRGSGHLSGDDADAAVDQEREERQARHQQLGSALHNLVQQAGPSERVTGGGAPSPGAHGPHSSAALGGTGTGFNLGSVRRSIMRRGASDVLELPQDVSDAERKDIVRRFQQLAATLKRHWTVSALHGLQVNRSHQPVQCSRCVCLLAHRSTRRESAATRMLFTTRACWPSRLGASQVQCTQDMLTCMPA